MARANRLGRAMLAMCCNGIRHIKSWIALKEADWFEHEPDVGNRHDGPFLQTRNMMHVHDVPQDDIGVLDRAVRLGPRRQPKAAGMLIGIVACRVALFS